MKLSKKEKQRLWMILDYFLECTSDSQTKEFLKDRDLAIKLKRKIENESNTNKKENKKAVHGAD